MDNINKHIKEEIEKMKKQGKSSREICKIIEKRYGMCIAVKEEE